MAGPNSNPPFSGIDTELLYVARQLAARYPDLEIVGARLRDIGGAGPQQEVTFRGPLQRMIDYGLVRHLMLLNTHDSRSGRPTTPAGCGFHLFADGPVDWLAGVCGRSWDYTVNLRIFTGDAPRERPTFSVRDAERVLRKFRLPRRNGGGGK